jgi:hypothetical protein
MTDGSTSIYREALTLHIIMIIKLFGRCRCEFSKSIACWKRTFPLFTALIAPVSFILLTGQVRYLFRRLPRSFQLPSVSMRHILPVRDPNSSKYHLGILHAASKPGFHWRESQSWVGASVTFICELAT